MSAVLAALAAYWRGELSERRQREAIDAANHIRWARELAAPYRARRREREFWLHATLCLRYGQGGAS